MRQLSDLIPEYIEESREHLGNIEEDFILMEQGKHDDGLIDRISRVVRSIKGGASFLGLRNIEQLTRKIEEIFCMIRNCDLELSSETASRVLNAIYKLKEILVNAGTKIDFDINAHLLDLDACLHDKMLPASYRPFKLSDLDSAFMLDAYTFGALKKQNKKIFHLQFELREVHYQNYNNPLEFFREIEKTGEIIELNVDMELVLENDNFIGEGIPLNLIYATGLEKEIVAYIFGINEKQVMELEDTANGEKKRQIARKMSSFELMEEDNDEIKDKNEYLTFLIDNEEYGINVTHVIEIISFQEITRLTAAENRNGMLISFRGDIIPVYDFRLRLNLQKKEYDYETVILIVNINEKKIGVIVDRVSEMIHLTKDQITATPSERSIPARYIIGIGRKEGRAVIILKISEIFSIDLKEEIIA